LPEADGLTRKRQASTLDTLAAVPVVGRRSQPQEAPVSTTAPTPSSSSAPNVPSSVAAPPRRRPLAITVLAGFSLLLGIVTGIPQLYYVLFAINPGIFPIGPHANPLGAVWYWYILNGDNTYRTVDPGVLAGAIEDAFLLGPLYLATGIGLLRLRRWVIPVGLLCGGMIFYAILGFFLSDLFAGLPTVTNSASYWISNLPYLLYPLWLVPTLLVRRSLFLRRA
jgi:hypothetical protein